MTRIIPPESPADPIEWIEMEAVHSRRFFVMDWRELTDTGKWRQGWLP